MNLGMSKYYKFLIPFVLLIVSGCTVYQNGNKAEPELIAQEQQSGKKSIVVVKTVKEVNSTVIAKPVTHIKEELHEKKKLKVAPVKVVKETPVEPQKVKVPPIVRMSTTSNKRDHKNFGFDLIQKGVSDNNTLFIVGGIQGDEPGGFMAASLIATQYKITKGSLWVIPNLNFYSIIKRSRGPFGDMNRKFAELKESDPDFEAISKIKSYIEDDKVKLIVNLHDGSGYYRDKYIDKEHSPHRWGQCSIVDQERLDCERYGDLKEISSKVVAHVNANLIREEDRYSYNNTRTSDGNKEMAKTLTYFAINRGKAAFGNEASKNLPTHERAYYHLLALEKYMDVMGIEFERKFELNPKAVKEVLDNNIYLSIEGNSISLPLSNIRNILRYFPVSKDGSIKYVPSNPLLKIIKNKNTYTVYYGNRRLTHLQADYIDYARDDTNVHFEVDNRDMKVMFGDIVKVKKEFLIHNHEVYRVNVIGYSNSSKKETDMKITKDKIMKRYSVDKDAQIYRVEFYKKDKFAGTVLVKFEDV
ncbi:MAG: M99 family carboxypeptidase catalytic domain-containing protein [Campylobacterota bacterium]|nr:M99 family carboxypeptidase catalytic domain-containing protein [Campylobacterota bacterium]